jgi:hypothetical protein
MSASERATTSSTLASVSQQQQSDLLADVNTMSTELRTLFDENNALRGMTSSQGTGLSGLGDVDDLIHQLGLGSGSQGLSAGLPGRAIPNAKPRTSQAPMLRNTCVGNYIAALWSCDGLDHVYTITLPKLDSVNKAHQLLVLQRRSPTSADFVPDPSAEPIRLPTAYRFTKIAVNRVSEYCFMTYIFVVGDTTHESQRIFTENSRQASVFFQTNDGGITEQSIEPDAQVQGKPIPSIPPSASSGHITPPNAEPARGTSLASVSSGPDRQKAFLFYQSEDNASLYCRCQGSFSDAF